MKDLHILPKVRDGWTYLYVEHARIDQHEKAIAVHDKHGRTPVPCAMLTTLMLGPGTTITHAAARTLAEHGCLVVWSGEDGVRFYAQGLGETRSSANLMHQSRLWADPERHLDVVRRLYEMRFSESIPSVMSLRQIRGREGLRVRAAYAEASRRTGVPWAGRSYKRDAWHRSDSVNRALSAANACLYGVCHAAIVAAGFSPALGFIHTGKMLSFVYDVADVYKSEISIPAAFDAAGAAPIGVERRARERCRALFRERRLLARLVPDIQHALFLGRGKRERDALLDTEASDVGALWAQEDEVVPAGVNYAAAASDDRDDTDPIQSSESHSASGDGAVSSPKDEP